MADRPILFSAPMVRALLAGTKTQTRRVIKPTKKDWGPGQLLITEGPRFGGTGYRFIEPYAAGDRLWVRETWRAGRGYDGSSIRDIAPWSRIWFAADDCNDNADAIGRIARPSIFMPRWASRLTLTVTDVRVERLQDISEVDAIREGVTLIEESLEDPVEAYKILWNSINGPGAWEENPWIVAVSFDVRKGNIDG